MTDRVILITGAGSARSLSSGIENVKDLATLRVSSTSMP
jgi:hypothetical protein